MKKLLKLLLGTSLYVLEQSDRATKKVRERAAGEIDDLRDAAQQKYEAAADRLTRASRALRGDDSHMFGNALRFTAGIGVGVGLGLILAPARGEDTRSAIAGTVQDFGSKVRKQFSCENARATGTKG